MSDKDIPLSESAIKEFTIQCGMHYRLALCEHTVTGDRKIYNILYVTDDKKSYTRETHGGRWMTNDGVQIGLSMSDAPFFMDAEKMKFIKWL